MDENQNEEEVLLVADKDDGGKLKAVDKSAAREGIFRMLLPSMENMDDFVRVSSQSTILEDFSATCIANMIAPPTSGSIIFRQRCSAHWMFSPICSGIRRTTRISLHSTK